MAGLSHWDSFWVLFQAAASAGLVIRFSHDRLNQTYPFFFIYLLVFFLQETGPLYLKIGTNSYAWFFGITEAATVFLYALVTLELYTLVLKDLPGVATIARGFIRIALCVAIAVSVLLLGLERGPSVEAPITRYLARFFSIERPIVTSLIVFVFLISAFLMYYPIPLKRNVIYYTLGYAVYFTSKGTALFLRNTGHNWDSWFSQGLLVISSLCLVFWLFALSRKGELAETIIGHRWTAEDEGKVLQQLEAINTSFSRSRK